MRLRNASSALARVVRTNGSESTPLEEVLQTLGMSDQKRPVEGYGSELHDARVKALVPDEIDPSRQLIDVHPRPGSVTVTEWDAIRQQANSKFADQLRGIVANLSGTGPTVGNSQFIVVSGVDARRESSIVAASLAITCAGTGYQVLLVDANLARPTVHTMFGVSNQFGLSDLLRSSDPPNALVQATSVPNLGMIAAGSRVSNYASLLSRQRIRHRLAAIAPLFDYIIVDGSALAPALLARVAVDADQVTLAVKRHRSSMTALESAHNVLREEGVENTSVLLVE